MKKTKKRKMYSSISWHEAQSMGVQHNLKFKRCNNNYRGVGLYVIEFEGGGVKIGIARNLVNRLKVYASPWVKPIKRLHCYSSRNPYHLEQTLRKTFWEFKANNSSEYFLIEFDKVIKTLESNPFHDDDKPTEEEIRFFN